MSNPLMEKMLGLPEFEVTDFKQNEYDMGFYVETKKRPTLCPGFFTVALKPIKSILLSMHSPLLSRFVRLPPPRAP